MSDSKTVMCNEWPPVLFQQSRWLNPSSCNPHQISPIPVGRYVYSITCPLILTISPAAILNLPTNSFCLLDTALELTSDNSLLHFPPSIPLATSWWHLSKTLVMPSLMCAHIQSLSFDWERRQCPYISILFPFVCSCACPPWSLQFLVRVFTFLSLILCYLYFGTFLSMWNDTWKYY